MVIWPYLELKNQLTGQNYKHSENQYRFDRDPKEPFLHFKRVWGPGRVVPVGFAICVSFLSQAIKTSPGYVKGAHTLH